MKSKFSRFIQVGKLVNTSDGKVYRVVSKITSSQGDMVVRLADLQGDFVPTPEPFIPVTSALKLKKADDDDDEQKQPAVSVNVSGAADLLSGSGGEAAGAAASAGEAAGAASGLAEAIAPLALVAALDASAPVGDSGNAVNVAYDDGYKAGHADKYIGSGFLQVNKHPGTSEYSKYYCKGYEDGYAGREARLPYPELGGVYRRASQWEVPKCKSCGKSNEASDCLGCKEKFCPDCLINHHANNPAHSYEYVN